MTPKQEEYLYEASLKKFGEQRQWDKLTEEMAEVIHSIQKAKYEPTEANKKRVMEEIVDLDIVMNQLIRTLDGRYMNEYKRKKLKRLRDIVSGKLGVK